MNAPAISRDQLIADERAAELAVVTAESAWLLEQATGTPSSIAAARAAVDAARTVSLAIRQRMVAGLAEWTQYAAYREAVAHAEANGIPLPVVT